MVNKKIVSILFCLVFLLVPPIARAQSTVELMAQIQALQNQLNQLTAQLRDTGVSGTGVTIAGRPAICAGIVFSRNLITGVTGNDVRCLQAVLNQSADTMVAASSWGSPGYETVYFGPLTRAAVAKFQTKYSLLAGNMDTAGFVGTATRAKLNSMLAVPTIPTGTGTTGTTGTTGSTNMVGGITINGQEGTLIASVYPVPPSGTKVYEGNSRVGVLGVRLAARGSDLSVQRLGLEFDSRPQNLFSSVYIYDGNKMIDSMTLNDATVSRITSTRYSAILTDFIDPVVIPQGTDKVLTVRVDVQPGISSGIITGSSLDVVISVPAAGIRAMDQARLSQYSPSSGSVISRVINVNRSLASDASLWISRNANSPQTGNLIADSNGNINNAVLLFFDVTARRDNLVIDDINRVVFSTGAGFLVPHTAYLYDDNGTVIDVGTPNQSTGIVDFQNINIEINQGTTRTFAIRIDDDIASNGADNGKRYRVNLATDNGITAYFVVERSNGTLLGASDLGGAAQSNDHLVFVSGPVFTLNNVTTTVIPATSFSPSVISAEFTIRVSAQGGDVYLPKTGAFDVYAVYQNNIPGTLVSDTVYRASGVLEMANSYRISQDTTATFIVNSSYARSGPAGSYNLRVEQIDWGYSDSSPASNQSTYMANDFMSGYAYLQ